MLLMHIFKQSMLATAIILGASSTALAKEELTVYTSFETDLLALFKNTFEQATLISILNGYEILPV